MKPRKSLATSVEAYYQTLKEFEHQRAFHEGAVSVAFQTLLADATRAHGWTLIPQLSDKNATGGIRPDGTLKDQMNLVRGHWEAKDTSDDLDEEIARKIRKGYPLGNIIFEDTRNVVLYQNKSEVMRVDLKDADQLVRLLDQFFAYIEPQIASFEKAVNEFKARVPELAQALKAKVIDAHTGNRPFKEAFERFFELCKTALDPNIAKEAVDDMLVQHLLTERLIREIFDNPEFTRRNVIAAEIEKVIAALTSKAFDRNVFLKSLDRFYVAIENAARTITEWSDKQHFLNTVYERFFQGYSVRLADTMGIVYTPQPIVNFMCASVAEVLEKEFGKTLGSPDVNILDPCTGTANFIVNLMRRISKRDLPRVYKQQMFANEIMLLPYYIAAMNIEHAYYELTGDYEPFDGLCFVDTLDLLNIQSDMRYLVEANTARIERQRGTPITVIIGNPPYNANQVNENDNNKNRKYDGVDHRIRETYARDSEATLKNKLYDPYVKFFRWAADRLGPRDGIVCYVSNNSFAVDPPPFDGMRKHLLADFDTIYHVDLHGNVRHNPKLSGTTHNVFGIQVGVGITLAMRLRQKKAKTILYHRVPEDMRREEKLSWLSRAHDVSGVNWRSLSPDEENNWIRVGNSRLFDQFMPIGDPKAGIFGRFSTGAKSNRDDVVYDFSEGALLERVRQFSEAYNAEVDRWKRSGAGKDVDSFVSTEKLQWSSTLKLHLKRGRSAEFSEAAIRVCLYRPFTKRYLYFDDVLNDRPGIFRSVFPTVKTQQENRAIYCTSHTQMPFVAQITDCIANEAVGGRAGHCFPVYVYDEDGSNRRENITDWALEQFRTQYKDAEIGKWDVFHYVYGVLHHPGYRTTFADNLKRELPRIPFAPDFRAFSHAGELLAALHVDYERLEPWELSWIETPGVPLSYRVQKMKLSKDKTMLTVNESLTLGGIPPDVFEYRLGNRSALEWVIDQYQVFDDKRSGIVSDPNREDDPQYIVRLVGQVLRVSIETVKLVKSLPPEFAPVPAKE